MIGTWDYGYVDAGTMPDRMLFTRIAETIGWCRMYSRYLLAYVPAELIDHAARGIRVNPEECIAWLSDAPLKLCERIANSNGRTG